MTHNKDPYPEGEEDAGGREPEAAWLGDLLRASRSVLHRSVLPYCREEPPPEFTARCAEAVQVAVALAKLSTERQRIGFVPLPIRDYLESLAQGAQVALEPVLRWAGIADLSGFRLQLAHGWARMAQGIGIGLSEAVQHFRISFAESRGENAFAALLARAGFPREQTDPVAEAERAFQQWARTIEPAEHEELRAAETEIRTFFDTRGRVGG